MSTTSSSSSSILPSTSKSLDWHMYSGVVDDDTRPPGKLAGGAASMLAGMMRGGAPPAAVLSPDTSELEARALSFNPFGDAEPNNNNVAPLDGSSVGHDRDYDRGDDTTRTQQQPILSMLEIPFSSKTPATTAVGRSGTPLHSASSGSTLASTTSSIPVGSTSGNSNGGQETGTTVTTTTGTNTTSSTSSSLASLVSASSSSPSPKQQHFPPSTLTQAEYYASSIMANSYSNSNNNNHIPSNSGGGVFPPNSYGSNKYDKYAAALNSSSLSSPNVSIALGSGYGPGPMSSSSGSSGNNSNTTTTILAPATVSTATAPPPLRPRLASVSSSARSSTHSRRSTRSSLSSIHSRHVLQGQGTGTGTGTGTGAGGLASPSLSLADSLDPDVTLQQQQQQQYSHHHQVAGVPLPTPALPIGDGIHHQRQQTLFNHSHRNVNHTSHLPLASSFEHRRGSQDSTLSLQPSILSLESSASSSSKKSTNKIPAVAASVASAPPPGPPPVAGYRIPASGSLHHSTFPLLSLCGPAFKDLNGQPIYVCSAILGTAIHPGKAGPHLKPPVRITFAGKEILHDGRFDLLPITPDMKWVDAKDGLLPEGGEPIQAGYEETGEQLHHALTQINNLWVPGKTGKHLKGANFPYSGGEVRLREGYKVLCWRTESDARSITQHKQQQIAIETRDSDVTPQPPA